MKSYRYDYARDDKMAWVDDGPEPTRKRKGLLVQVQAVAPNPADYKMIDQLPLRLARRGTPVGMDFAGAVVEAPGHGPYRVGDRVYGQAPRGALAELVAVGPKTIGRIPDGVSATDAATLPTAAGTAMKGLGQVAGPETGQALIIGASGGVGSFAVQIAKALGVQRVTAVASGRNASFVRDLGADLVLDYTAEGFVLPNVDCPAGSVDVLLDCVTGPETFDYEPTARLTLKEGAVYTATLSPSTRDFYRGVMAEVTPLNLQRRGYNHLILLMKPRDYARLAGWLADGSIRPAIAEALPFTEAGCEAAMAQLKTHRTRGKLVIDFSL